MNKILVEKISIPEMINILNLPDKYIELQGHKVKIKNDKYLNYLKNGFKCKNCGVEGIYANLEYCNKLGNHFNMYANKNGNTVLLTTDHIYPRSKGGLSNIKNYQVLCSKCNNNKADNSPITLVEALQKGYATKKSVEKAVKNHRPAALKDV